MRERREIFEAFFQPGGISQIFIPTNKLFFERVMRGECPQRMYKGVSYNPFVAEFGERFENIDFFSWAKRVQEKLPGFYFIVYDAGMYQLINEMSEERFPKQYDEKMAEKILTELQNALRENAEVRNNVDTRNRYLQAILDAGAVRGEVIDARDVLTPDNMAFVEAFQFALGYCRDKASEDFRIGKFVRYRRYEGDFAKSYTPLVIAEAIWLYDIRGNDAKFGPTTERGFDSLIREALRETRKAPYLIMWFTRSNNGIEKYQDNLFFADDPDAVRKKLSNEPYRRLIKSMITPFSREGALEELVIAFMDAVNAQVKNGKKSYINQPLPISGLDLLPIIQPR